MQVLAVAWMDHDSGVVTLGENGIVSTWTRNVSFPLPSPSGPSFFYMISLWLILSVIFRRLRTNGNGLRSLTPAEDGSQSRKGVRAVLRLRVTELRSVSLRSVSKCGFSSKVCLVFLIMG